MEFKISLPELQIFEPCILINGKSGIMMLTLQYINCHKGNTCNRSQKKKVFPKQIVSRWFII